MGPDFPGGHGLGGWGEEERCSSSSQPRAPGRSGPETIYAHDGILCAEEPELSLDADMQLKLLAIMENPAVIVAGAASGNLSIVKDFLTKHPFEVRHDNNNVANVLCGIRWITKLLVKLPYIVLQSREIWNF